MADLENRFQYFIRHTASLVINDRPDSEVVFSVIEDTGWYS